MSDIKYDKECCPGLPVGDHCSWCDDDEPGDYLGDVERDRKLDEKWESEHE